MYILKSTLYSVCVCVCVYIYIYYKSTRCVHSQKYSLKCVCVCVYVCIYIYIIKVHGVYILKSTLEYIHINNIKVLSVECTRCVHSHTLCRMYKVCTFSNVLSIVTFHSKCTRTLTFEYKVNVLGHSRLRIPGAQIVSRRSGCAHHSRRTRVLVRLWKARRCVYSFFFCAHYSRRTRVLIRL